MARSEMSLVILIKILMLSCACVVHKIKEFKM